MNNQEYYEGNQYYSDVPAATGGNSLARIPEISAVAVSQSGNRAVRRMERRVEMEATQERCKVRLMGEVVVNTTALSALADQAVRVVPSAEKPVRHVVEKYAVSSAERIASRW